MLFVFIGLNLSENIENFVSYVLFWVVYGLVTLTLLNTFLVGYFWSIIRKKTGPPGIKGPKGDDGKKGVLGQCDTNSSNAICLIEVTKMLDELYRSKEGSDKTIIENDVLINGYMKRKVATICKSVQFDVLTEVFLREGKSIGKLIDYIKGIFKEWFFLIYNQNRDWFADPNGLQKYDWKDTNPFNEIKKYDLFYWGDTRRFKPLKNKICKNGQNGQNNEVALAKQLPIKMIQTNNYYEVYDDKGSKGNVPLKAFRAKKYEYNGNTYYPVGDVISVGLSEGARSQIGVKKDEFTLVGDLEFKSDTENGPDKQTILVSGNVVDPIGYRMIWRDQKYTNSYADELRRGVNAIGSGYMEASTGYGAGRIWKPIAPEGYVCLGDVFTNYYPPDHEDRVEFLKYNKEINVKCIPASCVEEVLNTYVLDNKRTVWVADNNKNNIVFNGEINVLGSGKNNEAVSTNAYNLFRADNMSYVDSAGKVITMSGDKFYRIKESCLKDKPAKIKQVEPEFEQIGIGWYGNPTNNTPKYSIYHFMGLIPEGMILHDYSQKKYYITHYGGNEFNCYNILVYNSLTGKYDMALEITPGTPESQMVQVAAKKLQKNNRKQQWKLMKDNEYIYFQSWLDDKILQINNNIFEAATNMVDTSRFEFIPAFGVGPETYWGDK